MVPTQSIQHYEIHQNLSDQSSQLLSPSKIAAPSVKMKTPNLIFILLSLLLCDTPVSAFWRLQCHGSLGVARVDPIMSPGKSSNHAHTGHGAQSFGFNTDYHIAMAANCTSCTVTQDRSIYWTPALYFQHKNGSFELVNTVGGMLAYYFNDNVELDQVHALQAFPPGFQMIAGDMRQRNASQCDVDKPMSYWNETDMTQECLAAKSVGMNCLHYDLEAEPSLFVHFLRPKSYLDAHCTDGIRAELQFPSCWNGHDLDSPDHKSHVAYPNLLKTGDCPPGFPHRLPVLFYETVWDTYPFRTYPGQYVFAQGDPTGYGYHGDFMCGWNESFLQSAVETCTNESGEMFDCPLFTLQDDSIATSCKMDIPDALKNEDVSGPISSLPGNVAIQSGPGYAVMPMGQHPSASYAMPGPVISSQPLFSNTTSSTPPPTMSTTNLAPPPVTTPPPNAPISPSERIIYTTITSTFISDGVSVVMVIVEEFITVTVTVDEAVTIGGASKRRAHKHVRNGRHR